MSIIQERLKVLESLYIAKHSIDKAIAILEDDSKMSLDNIIDERLSHILAAVSAYFSITIKQMSSKSRKREVVNARHIFFKLAREIIPDKDASLEKIGNRLGKDHATVLHAIKNIDNAEFTKDNRWYDYLNIKDIILKDLKQNDFEQSEENDDE